MKKLLTPIVFVLLICTVSQTNATKMLHRNAQELTQLAQRAFVGVCISVEEKQMSFKNGSALRYTEYLFEVVESIKGANSKTVVLRQVGPARGAGRIIGMPGYDPGKKYLLFLRGDSQYGLASPIGLGQGAFRVFKSKDGSEKALNEFGNRGLFHRMKSKALGKTTPLKTAEKVMLEQTQGPVELGTFLNLIKTISN